MGSWGLFRRRAAAKPGRSHNRKQQDSLRAQLRRGLRIEQFEERTLLSIGTWAPLGPSTIDYGQVTNVAPKNASNAYLDQVIGTVTAVAAHPTNSNILYVGTANGGIWRTSDATDANPTWTALTDDQTSLSIGSLAFDPTDASGQTLVAGIARTSEDGLAGGTLSGILRTTDGGATWTELDGGGVLDGKNCIGIAARGNTILVAVDNAESGSYSDVGIFRSTDGGATFTQISKTNGATTGLPGGIAYDLAADPTNSNVFYTAVVGADTFGGANGIYKTINAGKTWAKVSTATVDSYLSSGGTGATFTTHRVQISVGNSGQVYVGIVDGLASTAYDQLAAVFRSGDAGTSWTLMDLPTTVDGGTTDPLVLPRVTTAAGDGLGTLPSGQGTVDFSIVADPTNANIVYVGGYEQLSIGSASAIGATNYTGVLFRGDASKAAGKQWVHLTDSNKKGATGGGTADSSAPHFGSRDMAFDAGGRLIEADDGGVYVRTSPRTNSGDWYSLNGTLQITEVEHVAYDTVSNIAIAGTLNTGVAEQTATGSTTWNELIQGDGCDVAVVDNDVSLAGLNESYRYTSGPYLSNFERQIVDANNKIVSTTSAALVVAGSNNLTFNQVDGGQLDTPFTINAVDPTRMVIGGATSVFESFNRGDTLYDLGAVGNATAMVYGGYQGAVANADVLWVASNSGVYLRTSLSGTLTKTAYAGGTPRDIAVDPTDWTKAYVIDDSHVYYTKNAGATWTDITGSYTAAAGFRSLQFVHSGNSGAILVAGFQGVYESQVGKEGTWYQLGADLPNVPVYDMNYDAQDNLLVVGTLGRGTWELTDVRSQIFGIPALVSVSVGDTSYLSTDSPTLTTAPTELTLTFNDNQVLDPTTLSGIEIVCAGPNGTFYDPVTNPYDTDDVVITPGYVGIGDKTNEVVVRFANTLPDGLYHILIVGQGSSGTNVYYGADGKLVQPLTNAAGIPVGFSQVTASGGTTYWDGVNSTWTFDLTLAPQITSVVPQPITRGPDGVTLSQARNQIQVYFSGAMDVASAQTLSYYQLIVTDNTANTADDKVILPTAAVYDSTAKMVTLTFSDDLANLGTGSFRLRIGDAYSSIVTTERTDIVDNSTDADVGDTYATAAQLGSFSTSTGQSWIISGAISPIPYALEWPGGQDTSGERSLPPSATDVAGENHTPTDSGDTGPDGTIPTYYYNFQSVYGSVNGSPVKNLITAVEEERVREIFSLLTQYCGVQFVESASSGITVAVGDLRAIDATTVTGVGSAAGMAAGDASSGLAIINNFYDWGTSDFGGSFMQVAMHEIMHTLGFGHSFDLTGAEIMGSSTPGGATGDPGSGESQDSAVGGDAAFPDNGDIVSAQYLYRKDSMDIDLYEFVVDQEGSFSAETIAARLENASSLNTMLMLFNSDHQEIASNDDYYGTDSYINVQLAPGTYYIGVSASGNSQYNPSVPDSGIGGTTEGPYQLRLDFQPQNTSQLVDARGIALDGDADGTPGGEYNFWFNVQSASGTASANHTIIVDKLSPGPTYDGTLAHPYNTVSAALTAAAATYNALTAAQIEACAGVVVRIVGNNFANDNLGDSIQAVAGSYLTDGQTFTISDATQTYTFELDNNNRITSGNIRVPFTAADTASTVAASIAKAVNSVSWIPSGLGTTTTTRYYGGLDANATVTGANLDVVSINGATVSINLGSSTLKSTLQDDKAYEIGTNPLGQTLSDGKTMDVPKGVTVMIDAGAVFKLRGANIDVGSSSQNVNRSLGAVQVLGTPTTDVYFTSYLNERIGVDTYANATTPSAGDWGGLVFENDYDYAVQATDPTRRILEQQGIFLDYVNHANISYGGGKVTVNGVQGVYDPIHMIEARPTISFNTITHSADAALSADPNSLLESEFYSGFGESLYTLDYGRVGPDVHGNTLVQNSINGLFLRIDTTAGGSLEELTDTARYDSVDTVLAIPENLVIQGDAGEAVAITGTCPLTADDSNDEIVVPMPAAIPNTSPQQYTNPFVDRQYFTLSDTYTTVRFEFDVLNNGVTSGSQPIYLPKFTSTDTKGDNYFAWMSVCAKDIVTAITAAASTYGLKITATVGSNGTSVVLGGSIVVINGLTGQEARMAGGLTIDPGTVVKLYGTRIEAGFGARFTAEGTAANPIIFTSVEDDSYGAGGTFDTTNDGNRQTAAPGDWGGIYFNPTSQGSIDYARVFYAGGSVTIAGEEANFAPIEIRQATVRIADSLFQYNTCSTTTDDRNGLGDIEQAAVIYVLFSQPVIVNNVIRDNLAANATDDADEVAAISVDVNSLNSLNVQDWGRSTGLSDAYSQYDDNYGPLVRGNALTNNDLNGMVVRAGTLTTEGIWDDTDIAHIVFGEIVVPNFDTYGGLRLQSSSTASLVVKLSGANAGFTATGNPLEITDRIGGTLQILGTAGHDVVLTDLADDTVSAGFDPDGNPMFDTDNNPNAVPTPGAWRSIELDEYSNDRNVAVVNESEPAAGPSTDANDTIGTAQAVGALAQNEQSGDETLRLGIEVHGSIAADRPDDADVYSFQGYAGTQVYITLDQTTFSLDSVIELIDADGNVLARSDNWRDEDANPSLLTSYFAGNIALPMTSDAWGYNDVYSINPKDAALRVVLPGTAGQQQTYYVRVYSALDIGNIDAAHVPGKTTPSDITQLDGETFQISDATNTSATFEFINLGAATPTTPAAGDTAIYYNTTTSSNITGIRRAIASTIDGYSELTNIDAFHVTSLAALNGETFQIADADGTTTYEFVDQKGGAKLAPTGYATVFYNSATDTIATLRTDIVKAINDNHITIGGIDVAHVPYLSNLDGETFQITYGNDQTANFEFINTYAGTRVTPGYTPISFYYDSDNTADPQNQTINDVRTAMVAAINKALPSSTAEPTAQAMPDGTVVIHGTDFLFDAGTTPFTQTGRSYTAVVMPNGSIAVYGPDVVLTTATAAATPFSQAQIAGTAVACTANILPDGDVALYGPKVVLNTGTTPFSQIGRTSGEYQMQIKLGPDYEHPGSTVQYADIRYATDGIEALGLPDHSPLTSDYYDSNAPGNATSTSNSTYATAQSVGNLLQSDQGMINVSGYMNGYQDVSWYSFTVNYQNDIERISGVTTSGSTYPVIIDVDYADGMSRPDTVLWIFDDTGALILTGDVSNIIDDNTAALQGSGVDNLTQGSYGNSDPYIGPVYLPEGHTYYVAVASKGALPTGVDTDPTTGLMSTTQTTLRWEPVDSVARVAEDNVGQQNASGIGTTPDSSVLFGGSDTTSLELAANPFTLGDVVMYVTDGSGLYTADAYTGATETDVTAGYGLPDATTMEYDDLAMRNDGRLMTVANSYTGGNATSGVEQQLDTGWAALGPISSVADNINTYWVADPVNSPTAVAEVDYGIQMEAIAYYPLSTYSRYVFMVGNDPVPASNLSPEMAPYEQNLLYLFQETDNADGSVKSLTPVTSYTGAQLLTDVTPWASLATDDQGNPVGEITGMSFSNDGQHLYCVTNTGDLYEVLNWTSQTMMPVAGTATTPPEIVPMGDPGLHWIANITDSTGAPATFSGLTAGPPDVEPIIDPTTGQQVINPNTGLPLGRYYNMLFAITNTGTLYALEPDYADDQYALAQQVEQPVFVGAIVAGQAAAGSTSIETGIPATGLCFSTLDFNLWHVTQERDGSQPADYGHDVTVTYDKSRLPAPGEPYSATGDMSFYFGLDSTSDQPGLANYETTNTAIFGANGNGTYDLPGGAYGSLTTQTFDLTNYSADDAPYLYFEYFLDDGNPTAADYYLPDGSTIDFDRARVYASTDGANWTNMFVTQVNPEGNLANTGGEWVQERISLAAFAGQANIRLRFDFSTAGDMDVGENDYTGAYLQALDGEQLQDGDTFVLQDADGNPVPYEFDMGAAYYLPNVAGDAIADGQTFTLMAVDANGNPVPFKTFEFDKDGNVTAGNVAIPITDGESTAEVAGEIATIVNGLGLTTPGGTAVTADVYENHVTFTGVALGMRLNVQNPPASAGVSAGNLIPDGETFTIQTRNASGTLVSLKTFEFDKNGNVTAGNQAIAIAAGETTADVAAQIASVINGLKLTNIDGTPIVAVVDDYRVLLYGAEGISGLAQFSLDPTQVTAGVDGAGAVAVANPTGTPPTPAATPIEITSTMSAADVAKAIAAAIDPTMKTDGSLVHMVHYITYPDPLTGLPMTGPLPYGTSLAGDNGNYTSLFRGIYNDNEGFYVDNVVIGFAERGEMITQTPTDAAFVANTTFNFVDLTQYPNALQGIDSTGSYQLQIRLAADYGYWPDPMTHGLDLVRAIDTNDRLDDSYSLTIPSANDIYQGQTFAISDGTTSVTFQFVDQDVSTGTNGNYVPVYFSSNQTPAEVTASVVQAINSLNMAGVFNVSAVTNGTSNIVNLFGAATVSDLSAATTVTMPSPDEISNGLVFTISDGVNKAVFQFVNTDIGTVATPLGTSVPYSLLGNPTATPPVPPDTAATLAWTLFQTLTGYSGAEGTWPAAPLPVLSSYGLSNVAVYCDPHDDRNLVFTGVARIDNLSTSEMAVKFTDKGDENQVYDQGQLVLNGNKITYSADYAIVSASAMYSDGTVHPGPVSTLVKVNTQRLVPGIVIENNVLAFNGVGGIDIEGDPASTGAVPFARIVNNTIYGQTNASAGGVGINVGVNASPTLLNNIVANLNVGIRVDATSSTTVVGTTAYSGNVTNTVGVNNVTNNTHPIYLKTTDPLFVDAASGNFYPAEGSRIIDSAVDSLPDRTSMSTVREPLGISDSPILAPDLDMYGQLRSDDPSVSPPPGQGETTYKDRGAIDRVDFVGPTAALADPVDNDPAGVDRNPSLNDVTIAMVGGTAFPQFVIRLDDAGIGIAGDTVTADAVQVFQNGQKLTSGLDYFFVYDSTNNTIALLPATGVWASDNTYTIYLTDQIQDQAGNPLQPNNTEGTTSFIITLAGFNFGTAPMYTDATHTVSATSLPDGARHLVDPNVYLGSSISSEPDANISSAGDSDDDGVLRGDGVTSFQGDCLISRASGSGATTEIVVTASVAGVLDAWIDWNDDGVFDPSSEKVTFYSDAACTVPVVTLNGGAMVTAGANTLYFVVPTGLTSSTTFKTFARFRYSTTGLLTNGAQMLPTGEAPDGEVEDYQVEIAPFLASWGDAPDPTYPTLQSSDGAYHIEPASGVPDLYLGNSVAYLPDPQPNSTASSPTNDGVDFSDVSLIQGQTVKIAVTVHNTTGQQAYLNAWIDFNDDGQWSDSEQIAGTSNPWLTFDFCKVSNGINYITFTVPADAVLGQTFARFRVSTEGALAPTGGASDGEVEDYEVSIIPPPGTIEGNVWNDLNGDGVRQPNESGLAGWTVSLVDGSGIVTTTTTATDGSYNFAVSPGTYTVQEVPPTGWTQTGPNGGSYSVTVVSNTTFPGEDFFNHDDVSPTVTVNALAPTNNNMPTLTGTVTDPALSGGMGSVTVVVSGQTLTATLNGTTWTVTVPTALADGTYNVQATATDLSGNKSATATSVLTVDITPPTVAVTALVTKNSTPTLGGTVSDPVPSSGIAGVTVVIVGIGGSPLTATISGTTWSVVPPTALADGTYNVTATATDLAGNSNSATGVLIVDTKSPTATVNALPPTKNNKPTLSGTVTDPAPSSGIAGVTVVVGGQTLPATVSGTTWSVTVPTALTGGTYNVQATATDLAGNKSATATSVLTVDTTPPVVTFNALPPTKNNTPTLSGMVNDPPFSGGMGSVTVVIVGVGGSPLTATISGTTWSVVVPTALADGTYNVQATATDLAGNSASATSVLIVDTTPPVVTVKPLVINSSTPMLSGTVIDPGAGSGIAGVTVVVGGQTLTATVSGTTWSVTVPTALADGTYNVQATAVDKVGNSASDATTNELTVDTRVPTVTVIALVTNVSTPTLSGTVSDPAPSSGIAGVTVVVGGQTLPATVSGTTWSVTVPTALADGIYDVQATATDNAGNRGSDTTTNELTVNTTLSTNGHNFVLRAGAADDDVGQSVATAASGSVYVTGSFHDTVNFATGAGVYNLTSAGGSDIFVAAYSSSGTLLWARDMGGSGDDDGNAIAIGSDGAVYVAGSFSGTANFPSNANGFALTSAGGKDVFVAKFDSSGNIIWARGMGGATGDDVANAIAVAADGSVYTTGYFQGVADFDPGSNVYNLTAVGPKDAFVSKLDTNGNFVWADRMGGIGWSQGMTIGAGIAVAADGSVYTTGSFQGTADFDPGPGQSTLTCAGDTDAFVAKLDSAGNFVWARGMGGVNADYGAAIAVAADGSVYTTGGFMGIANFNPGGTYNLDSDNYHRIFISKLDSAGNFVWADAVGGTGWDLATGIALDASGNVYTTGGFWGTADFDPGAGTYILNSAGQKDAFVLKLDSAGNFVSAQDIASGTGDDAANAVAVTSSGTTYTTGYFQGTADFDPTAGVYNLTSAGGEDFFLSKFTFPQTFAVGNLTTTSYTVGDTVNIPWTASNVASNGEISLCYDVDTTINGNEHWIEIDAVAASNSGGTYAWNTTGVAPGTYYLAGYMYDGTTYTFSHSTQAITIKAATTAPQAFAVGNLATTSYTVGATVNIPWTASNVASNGKVSLCYDSDTVINGNEHWIEIDAVAASNSGGTYAWNTTGVAAGTYYLAGYMYGGGTYTFSHATQAITINAATTAPQAFAVGNLATTSYTVGATVNIPWTASNVASNGKVSLCYDSDTVINGNEHWIEIDAVAASNSGGTYAWNTTGVAAGTYYLAGYMYGGGTYTFSHATQAITINASTTAPQAFAVGNLATTSYTAGATVNIPWTASNVASNGKVSLCYDSDTAFNGNEHWIEIDAVAASNSGGTYAWNTTGVAAGTYYLAGYMYGGGAFTFSHATQAITITAATQAFTVGNLTTTSYAAGATVNIPWTASNVASNGKVSLCYDSDTVINGNEHWIEIDAVAASNSGGTYAWNTTGVAAGTYYLAGYMYGGGTFTFSHSTQAITIVGQTFAVGALSTTSYTAGTTVNIPWTASNVASNGKVSLCYDSDTAFNGNEHWIEIDAVAASNSGGTYPWNTTGVASGTYYLAGYLWDGNKTFTFSHPSQPITIADALTLATPQVQAPASLPADAVLESRSELTPIVNEAAHRLLGANDAALAGVSIQITNLPGMLLGETIGNKILIDRDAAGYGWFIDPTPADDVEFPIVLGPYDLAASSNSPAAGRADLLTTVMHEMGHVLGYEHSNSLDLMYPTLPLGDRRFLAGGPISPTALAAENNWNQSAADTDILDEVLASFNADNKKDWSWL